MEKELKVVLRKTDTDGTEGQLTARIGMDEGLELQGWDYGKAPQAAFGKNEYEWDVFIEPQCKDQILLYLLQHCFEQGIFSSDCDFREWLKLRGIESKLVVW